VTAEQLEDLAALLGVESVRIGHGTDLATLKKELRWNDDAFRPGR
jgi:L-arabinose isomerase